MSRPSRKPLRSASTSYFNYQGTTITTPTTPAPRKDDDEEPFPRFQIGRQYTEPLLPASMSDSREREATEDPEIALMLIQDDEISQKGVSVYEKKCILINRQMDSFGMGRYQWYIWTLCGLGYLLDLLWAQAFGLLLSPIQQEFGFGSEQTGNISVAFSAGLTAGAFVWGFLVDIVGRKWSFKGTVMIAAAFGVALGFSNTYQQFLAVTACIGFGVGGNIPIDTTITLEFLPQNRRFLLALLSIFQPIGVVICSSFAYAFIPNYSCSPNFSEKNPLPSCFNVEEGVPCCTRESNKGWRYQLYVLGTITVVVFFLRVIVFKFYESPKYLVFRGRDEKAIAAMQKIAEFNGTNSKLTMAHFEALERRRPSMMRRRSSFKEVTKKEKSRVSMLFSSWQMTRLTVLVWLTYAFDYFGFTVAGTYLPQIIAYKNANLNLTLEFTYRSYIYIYLPGILGVGLGSLMYQVPRLGRKYTMVISSALMATSIFLFTRVNSTASNIGINIMEYFFQSMFNAVLYGWTPEAFPAPVRGTACGIASFWGRLFSIVSPLIAERLYAGNGGHNGNAVLYLAGSVTLGCVVTTLLLPQGRLNNKG